MPYRKGQFINGEIYHIVSRAIDNNIIFKDIDDYYRGIFSIYEFNDNRHVDIRERRKIRKRIKETIKASASEGPSFVVDKREKLVEILCFCLMPNHIHLLLKQLKDNTITKFMRKVGTGYAGYFNRKYNRKGYVFQNRFLSVHIEDDDQLRIVSNYIHTNPLSLIEPGWKENGIKSPEKAIKFLGEEYKWSSFFDFIGKKNFPSVVEKEFLLDIMGGEAGIKEFINGWISYKKELNQFNNLFLE